MAHESIPLRFGPRPAAWLRPLTGRDEASVDDTSTFTAIGLVDRLLEARAPSALAPGAASALTAADRDQLLAAIYRQTFGDRIVSTLDCGACARPYDLSFSLGEMARAVAAAAPSGVDAEGSGGSEDRWLTLPGGERVRLPSGADECAVMAMSADAAERALLGRCGFDPERPGERERAGELLDTLAPLLDLTLDARCPECGATAPVRFDVQSFLLGSLMQERPRLLDDVHRLARGYGWPLEQILSLPRADRRTLVERIDAEESRARLGAR